MANSIRPLIGWAALLSTTALASGALAQTAEPAALEEIVVTAQRRDETLQKVPVSVAAVTAAQLQASGLRSTDSLVQAVPGYLNTRVARAAVPFIRGVGSQGATTGQEAAVATYVDGVYYMDNSSAMFSFNNIERVEVLKGPQGTLYGRNSTGGLINIITREPTVEPTARASLSYSSYETVETALYVSGGHGPVAADIAIYNRDQGRGFGHNLNTGVEESRLKETAIRASLAWEISPNDKLRLTADWGDNRSDMGLARRNYPGSILVGNVTGLGGRYDTRSSYPARQLNSDYWGGSARYRHGMDNGEIVLLSAFRNTPLVYQFDQESTPARLADVTITQQTKTWQNEALVNADFGRLHLTTGAFVFKATSRFYPQSIRSATPASNFDVYSRQRTTSYAAFAQLTFDLTDATRLTAGGRYTVDRRRFDGVRRAAAGHPSGAGAVLIGPRADKTKASEPTWRISIDHDLAEQVMIYASYNRGFKSGSYNLTDITAAPVNPETLDAFEAGFKSQLASYLRLNGSAFHYKYKDIQLQRQAGTAQVFLNAGSGRINGGELELTLAPPVPVGALTLTSAVSVLDAKYTYFPSGPFSVPNATGGNTNQARDLAGFTMIRSPKWTLAAGGTYSVPVGSGELSFNVNYYYNDGFFWDPDNRLRQRPYDVVNAQVALTFGNEGRYKARVFGTNLGDTGYFTAATAGSLGDIVSYAPPRMYGVGLEVAF